MAAIEYDPYLGDPGNGIAPHIPSTDNLGGTAKENDVDPPDPETMPDARDHIAIVRTVAAHARAVQSMVLSIDFASGDPFVYALSSANGDIVPGDLTLLDNAAGDTSITWDPDTFPVNAVRPWGLTLNSTEAIDRAYAVPITNGVRVYTDLAGSGTDASFTVAIQGQ